MQLEETEAQNNIAAAQGNLAFKESKAVTKGL